MSHPKPPKFQLGIKNLTGIDPDNCDYDKQKPKTWWFFVRYGAANRVRHGDIMNALNFKVDDK